MTSSRTITRTAAAAAALAAVAALAACGSNNNDVVAAECSVSRGDQHSGAGVIEAFNHAYYGQRDAAAARALATPNSSVVPADQLQPYIDAIPADTTYCLNAEALPGDTYRVDLTEKRPGGEQHITQTVTTKKIDGKWFVDVVN